MVCINHYDRNGVNTCSRCGAWLCDVCTISHGGQILCKICMFNPPPAAQSPEHPRPAPAHSGAHPPRHVSGFLFFICSFIIPLPGLNFMCLGLIKRGLLAMTAFFAIPYAAFFFDMPALLPLMAILWFACLFDAYSKKRLINHGIHVKDSVDDVFGFVKRHKSIILILIFAFSAFAILSQIHHFLFSQFFWSSRRFFGSFPLFIAVAIACLLLFRSSGGKKDKRGQDQGE